MNWFKENPFQGGLSIATAVLLLLAGYFLFTAQGRFTEQSENFDQQKSNFERLLSNKPFPSEDNVQALEKERDEALAMLHKIGASVQVEVPVSTPQNFQDALREKVNDITTRAEAQGVNLGADFFLGFNEYEAKPPTADAAPLLSLQLASIYNVASLLVDSKVKEISSIIRTPLPVEGNEPVEKITKSAKPDSKSKAKDSAKTKGDKADLPDLSLAPFEVNFTADQSAFQISLNRIIAAKPSIFIRLLGVTNSALEAPKKGAAAADISAQNEEQDKENNRITPILGREYLTVNLQLASISAARKGAQ